MSKEKQSLDYQHSDLARQEIVKTRHYQQLLTMAKDEVLRTALLGLLLRWRLLHESKDGGIELIEKPQSSLTWQQTNSKLTNLVGQIDLLLHYNAENSRELRLVFSWMIEEKLKNKQIIHSGPLITIRVDRELFPGDLYPTNTQYSFASVEEVIAFLQQENKEAFPGQNRREVKPPAV